jgi:type IV pilus assembly protein PilB
MNPLDTLREWPGVEGVFVDKVSAQMKETGKSLEDVLLESDMKQDDVRNFFASYYQIPSFEISENFLVTQELLDFIPEDSAAHYRMVPLVIEDEVLVVGANNPDDMKMREALNFISTKYNVPYRLVFLLNADVARIRVFYENLEGDVGHALDTLETELDAEIAANIEENPGQSQQVVNHIEEDAPVTKIVATILRYAVDGSASDIHIEPTTGKVGVRFRVDGTLATSLELPKNVHMAVVARVKILSAMRLDERRKPQDGRFSATFDDRKIDFRVSVLPTNHGEKVVMRILDTTKGVRTLNESGISPKNLEII